MFHSKFFPYIDRLLLKRLGVCKILLNFILNFLQLTFWSVNKSNTKQNSNLKLFDLRL